VLNDASPVQVQQVPSEISKQGEAHDPNSATPHFKPRRVAQTCHAMPSRSYVMPRKLSPSSMLTQSCLYSPVWYNIVCMLVVMIGWSSSQLVAHRHQQCNPINQEAKPSIRIISSFIIDKSTYSRTTPPAQFIPAVARDTLENMISSLEYHVLRILTFCPLFFRPHICPPLFSQNSKFSNLDRERKRFVSFDWAG